MVVLRRPPNARSHRPRDGGDAAGNVGISVGKRIVGEDAFADPVQAVGHIVVIEVDRVRDTGGRFAVEGDELDVGGDAIGKEVAPRE